VRSKKRAQFNNKMGRKRPNIMSKGHVMDETNFFKWFFGALLTIWLFLTKWSHSRISAAHAKIDEERKDNEARFNLVYEKIAESISKTEKCRNEIKKDLEVRMTEPHIKEYVGLKIEPLTNKVNEIHTDVKALLARESK